jgi:hypothetical protein
MISLNIEDVTSRVQSVFGTNTVVLSFNNLRTRVNNGSVRHSDGYLTSKQLNHVLRSSDVFTRVDPHDVGCNTWYDEKLFNKHVLKKEESIRNRINLWRMV